MNISKLGHLVDPLREMLDQYEWIIGQHRNSFPGPIAGYTCDFLPVEFVAAAGGLALSLPPSFRGEGCSAASPGASSVFDALVRPAGCCGTGLLYGVPSISFTVPGGYGEAHAAALAASMDSLLRELKLAPLGGIGRSDLVETIETYNGLRRLVRGILSLRAVKRDLLSQADLYSLMAAAASLPPGLVMEHLAALLGRMNSAESEVTRGAVPAVVHSCMVDSPEILDEMEDAGIVIVEDDTCNGRRQFDLSFSVDAADPAAEIFSAYSFKPLCPALRAPEERYELFYKLLKSYGIELVIFLESATCPHRAEEVDFQRKKLMRQGVDPLVVRRDNARAEAARYLERSGRGPAAAY